MRHDRPIKKDRRSLFLALQSDAKKYPGGIKALAEALGINGNTLSNGLNPDHDAPPPPFATIIEIISLTQAKQAMYELTQIVGQVPMDTSWNDDDCDEKCQIQSFLELVHSASMLLSTGSEAARDNRFDAREKSQLKPMLVELMRVTARLHAQFSE